MTRNSELRRSMDQPLVFGPFDLPFLHYLYPANFESSFASLAPNPMSMKDQLPTQLGHPYLRPKPDFSWTRKPQGKVAQFWWRWRLWFEGTFALCVLETWEKVLLSVCFLPPY
jgi:hypothetical protein